MEGILQPHSLPLIRSVYRNADIIHDDGVKRGSEKPASFLCDELICRCNAKGFSKFGVEPWNRYSCGSDRDGMRHNGLGPRNTFSAYIIEAQNS